MNRKVSIIIAALCVLNGAAAWAQSMYDAQSYSDINYYGTARTIAMGNAVTAVGGDLGSIVINPAGSAVAGYSQFVITPTVTLSTVSSSFAPVAGDSYSAWNKESMSRFHMPNIGVTCNFDTGNRFGLKKVTVGFVSNTTNSFQDRFHIQGDNNFTSMMGAFASNATMDGWTSDVLNSYDSYYSSSSLAPSWQSLTAYQSNMIATYDEGKKEYMGATETFDSEGNIRLAGPIYQNYTRKVTGTKSDMIFNVGLNFSDKFFAGFNLGMPVATYNNTETMLETSVYPEDFAIDFGDGKSTYFNDGLYRYGYRANMEGIYAKLGFIYLPVPGLRIGAAFQTPTAMNVEENWYLDGASTFSDPYYDRSVESPESEYAYHLRTPYIANFGVAYTLGSVALFSLDYELTDYSVMKLRDLDDDYYGEDAFYYVNQDIRDCYGISNSIRAGVEVKPLPEFAVRAGFTYKDCPEFYYEGNTRSRYKDPTMAFSFGLGYSSPKSFFADVAARWTKYPDSAYYPYDDYLYDDAGNVFCSPVVYNTRNLFDIVMTLGWRF